MSHLTLAYNTLILGITPPEFYDFMREEIYYDLNEGNNVTYHSSNMLNVKDDNGRSFSTEVEWNKYYRSMFAGYCILMSYDNLLEVMDVSSSTMAYPALP